MSETDATSLPLTLSPPVPSTSSIRLSARRSRRVVQRKASRPPKKKMKKTTPKFVIDSSDSECDTSMKYSCDKCSYSSDKRYNFKRHGLKHSPVLESKGKFECPHGCEWRTTRLVHMDQHLHMVHGIQIEVEELTLDNDEALWKWMDDLREKEFCKYISKSSTNKRSRIYVCHRSNIIRYVCTSKGIRRPRKLGSVKSELLCTSRLIVQQNTETEAGLSVTYYKTHSGHTIDPERIGCVMLKKRMLNQSQVADSHDHESGEVSREADSYAGASEEDCRRIGTEYFDRMLKLVNDPESGNEFVDIMKAGLAAMQRFREAQMQS